MVVVEKKGGVCVCVWCCSLVAEFGGAVKKKKVETSGLEPN